MTKQVSVYLSLLIYGRQYVTKQVSVNLHLLIYGSLYKGFPMRKKSSGKSRRPLLNKAAKMQCKRRRSDATIRLELP